MKYLLGIDFGGGASKATLLTESGEAAAESLGVSPTDFPRSGWEGEDPEAW